MVENNNYANNEMGPALSFSRTKIINDVYQELNTKCESNRVIEQDATCTFTIENCDNFHGSCKNEATQKFQCTLDASTKAFQDALAKAGAKAKAGFGIAAAASDAEINQKIKTIMETACSDDSKIKQTLANGIFNCKNSNKAVFDAINKADQKTACFVQAMADAGQKASGDSNADAEGATLLDMLGGLGGMIGIIIAIVVVIVIVSVLGKVLKHKKGGGGGGTTVVELQAPVSTPVVAPAPGAASNSF